MYELVSNVVIYTFVYVHLKADDLEETNDAEFNLMAFVSIVSPLYSLRIYTACYFRKGA